MINDRSRAARAHSSSLSKNVREKNAGLRFSLRSPSSKPRARTRRLLSNHYCRTHKRVHKRSRFGLTHRQPISRWYYHQVEQAQFGIRNAMWSRVWRPVAEGTHRHSHRVWRIHRRSSELSSSHKRRRILNENECDFSPVWPLSHLRAALNWKPSMRSTGSCSVRRRFVEMISLCDAL